ncbi:unnamed protein product, partial [Meganyctiphanes norvegica]
MLFSRPGAARSGRVQGRSRVLTLSGSVVNFVSHHRYLGLIFDSHMTWRPHVANLRSSMTSRINVLKAVSGRDWGADRASLLMLYKGMVRPKMEYASILYSCAATSTLRSLYSVQYQCLRIATGALTGVRTDSLEVEADVPPLQYHFDFVCLRTAAAIIALEGHPIAYIFQQYDRFLNLCSPPFSTRAHSLSVVYNSPLFRVDAVPALRSDLWSAKSGCVRLNLHLHKSDCPVALLQEARLIVNSYPGATP